MSGEAILPDSNRQDAESARNKATVEAQQEVEFRSILVFPGALGVLADQLLSITRAYRT